MLLLSRSPFAMARELIIAKRAAGEWIAQVFDEDGGRGGGTGIKAKWKRKLEWQRIKNDGQDYEP